MKSISSSQNPLYKELKAIATTSKARREYGQTLIEGVHLAESYLESSSTPELCIVSESSAENAEVVAIVTECVKRGVERLMITDSQYKALSSVDNGIGVMLLIKIPENGMPLELTESALILDGVQDPGNVGAMLRTAAAAGIREVYCSPQTASIWSPKVLRAGMGAQMALTVYENVNLKELILNAKIPVFATTLQATKTLYEVDLSGSAAWLLGNEGQGVSKDLLELEVNEIIIPQTVGVESLNVAAATAVCLFEHRRQQLAIK